MDESSLKVMKISQSTMEDCSQEPKRCIWSATKSQRGAYKGQQRTKESMTKGSIEDEEGIMDKGKVAQLKH